MRPSAIFSYPQVLNSRAALKTRAAIIPQQMASCIQLDPKDAIELYTLLHRLLDTMREEE
jgi:hypothetical protein